MRDDAPVLHVDPIACDGHGLCAELFPERTVSPAREVHHLVVPGDDPGVDVAYRLGAGVASRQDGHGRRQPFARPRSPTWSNASRVGGLLPR